MRATVLAGGFTPLCKATYFADMGDADTAAQIVESAPGAFASEYYEELLHLVKYLEGGRENRYCIFQAQVFDDGKYFAGL